MNNSKYNFGIKEIFILIKRRNKYKIQDFFFTINSATARINEIRSSSVL